ncbi:hypothetical protein ACQPX6_03920 [Actinomycetospora sp. CA-101289]|uniref:hypothetical protein n=1 Tax=Actinomycetospora sp. CA-101289 TaxID=3239893 RepID=UPI003D957ED2
MTTMNAPTTCPCCGVVVMPQEMSYDFDGETVASLTREVAYLRATVARLRGAPQPAVHQHKATVTSLSA